MSDASTIEEVDEAREDALVRYGPLASLTVVALGLVLRLHGLSEYWLNPDEGIYYSTLTRHSLSAFWAEVVANAHPPLFYLLMRGAGAVTWDFVWLRGVSVLFGVLAIWAFWLVGRELGGRGRGAVVAGLVPAALLAVNAEAITLSQVIRPYMMLLALLALSLYHLLRYRIDPTPRRLALYLGCLVPALLIHYSAALAFASFCVVLVYYAAAHVVDGAAWRRLALAQLVPAAVFGVLYMWHVAAAIDSDLMGDALGPDGWLSPWLVDTPSEAWYSFMTFQLFHLPPQFRARAAILLMGAVGLSLTRDRLMALMVAAGLAVALAASLLDLYPFGPTRHDSWLVVFTLPAFGWLIADLVERGRRASWVGAGVLGLLLIAGGPVERLMGADASQTYLTEEKVIRQADLAPLFVQELEQDGRPRTILMSEQSYNLLMPLYADQREDAPTDQDAGHFGFAYGSRTIVVAQKWDWDGLLDLERSIDAVTEPGEQILVVVGGWGSSVFGSMPLIQSSGALVESVPVLGKDSTGRRIVRMMGMVIDPDTMPDPA